jgi:hypothetical protein
LRWRFKRISVVANSDADVGDDGIVDIDDLLAVINA